MLRATASMAGSSRTHRAFARPTLAPAASWPYAARVVETPLSPAVISAALHSKRLRILAVCAEPRTVAQIRKQLDLTRSAARHHVQVLERAGLLQIGPDGYTSGTGWTGVLAQVEAMAEDHARAR